MRFRGLTWDHPRGYNALAAANGPIQWDVQPLEGFESAPIAELCGRYDLVVLDHPHLGEALAHECIRPLDEVLDGESLDRLGEAAMGPAFASYVMAGRPWALPLDAATQVMAVRRDLLEGVPTNWDDIEALSRDGGVALSLAGPHALLSLLSVCAALDPALDMAIEGWPDDPVAEAAYERLARLAARTPAVTWRLNPIGLLNRMGSQDDIRLVPLVYGYVNYVHATRPVSFFDAPRAGDRPGSILGGTGIAISHRAVVDDGLRRHLLWLMSDTAQTGFIPDHDGQPGLRSAWRDPRVNQAWGQFYANTAKTLEAAVIRPRHDGYIAFQTCGSALLRDAFAAGRHASETIRDLRAMFEDSLPKRISA